MISVANDRCDLLCLDLPRAEALRTDRLDAGEATRRAAVVAALGDPTRLVIAMALRDGGELCVCDLAWIVERSQKLVSHHVRLLRAQSLVRSRRDGKMVMCALTDVGLEALAAVDRLAGVEGALG
jgi:DNA-binding transcriptional ArsR family regulator